MFLNFNLNYKFLWRKVRSLHRVWDPSLFLPFLFPLSLHVPFQHFILFQFYCGYIPFQYHTRVCNLTLYSPAHPLSLYLLLTFSSFIMTSHFLALLVIERSLVTSRSSFCQIVPKGVKRKVII